ncbi:hypothetical protein V6Z11_A01G101400 [Gossypium hirsutum]
MAQIWDPKRTQSSAARERQKLLEYAGMAPKGQLPTRDPHARPPRHQGLLLRTSTPAKKHTRSNKIEQKIAKGKRNRFFIFYFLNLYFSSTLRKLNTKNQQKDQKVISSFFTPF